MPKAKAFLIDSQEIVIDALWNQALRQRFRSGKYCRI